jgi:peptidoglycan hydrolase FlgJ
MINALHHARPILPIQPNRAELRAGKDFEAVMLTGFIEQMLPENIGGTEAPQAGADVWRSFMAQAIADQLASQNVTGISSLISNQMVHIREGKAEHA